MMFDRVRNRLKNWSCASDEYLEDLNQANLELDEAETELNRLREENEKLNEYKQLTQKLLKAVNSQTLTSWSAMGIIEKTLETMEIEQKEGEKVEG